MLFNTNLPDRLLAHMDRLGLAHDLHVGDDHLLVSVFLFQANKCLVISRAVQESFSWGSVTRDLSHELCNGRMAQGFENDRHIFGLLV